MTKILFQLQKGNMVSYTLSGLNIPLASGSGNIKSRQRIWDVYELLSGTELIYNNIIYEWLKNC